MITMVDFAKLIEESTGEKPKGIEYYYDKDFNDLNNIQQQSIALMVTGDFVQYLIKRIQEENRKQKKVSLGVVKGIRTNAWNGEEKEESLVYFIKKRNNGYWIYLVNGVTGYESCLVENTIQKWGIGWLPCVGTERKWDKLEINGIEMDKIRNHMKELGLDR
jgi:hypothetical protein